MEKSTSKSRKTANTFPNRPDAEDDDIFPRKRKIQNRKSNGKNQWNEVEVDEASVQLDSNDSVLSSVAIVDGADEDNTSIGMLFISIFNLF